MERKTVLVADDEPGVRNLIVSTLDADFELLLASDGEEALAIGMEHHPNLVLLDLMMPRMDGIEVCRRLKSNPETSDMVIIVITGRPTELYRQRAFAAGANDYIPKPFSPLSLLDRVHRVLGMAS